MNNLFIRVAFLQYLYKQYMDFGTVDPAAFVLALVAILIAIESLLSPICEYARRPRWAFTTYYKRSIIHCYDYKTAKYDYILSVAVSKAVFSGLWTCSSRHTYILMDSPIGFGQWLLYPVSQTGSGILTSLLIALITPVWAVKKMWIRFLLMRIRSPRTMGQEIGFPIELPAAFHCHILGHILASDTSVTSYSKSSFDEEAVQGLLTQLASSSDYILGPATLAFSNVEYPGIWTGVWFDLQPFGVWENALFLDFKHKHVMAGNMQLCMPSGSLEVWVLSSSTIGIDGVIKGCSRHTRFSDKAKTIRILLSHGIVDPIDIIISMCGVTEHELRLVRFTHAILELDSSIPRGLKSTNHWIVCKTRIPRKLKKLASTSPWCSCIDYCLCSLRGIMFAAP